MNWDATSNTNHYEIRFRAAVGGTWQILTSTSTSKTKYGLSAGTDYEWQVRSACSWSSSSFSAWSSIVSFTTVSPCTVPINLTANNVTSSSVDVSWDAVPGAWGYRVMYVKLGAAWSTNVQTVTNSNNLSVIGLDGGSMYSWRVKTICEPAETNNSSYSSFVYFFFNLLWIYAPS